MALIKCLECNKEVSDKAENCPNCGYPIQKYIIEITNDNDDIDKDLEQENKDNKIDVTKKGTVRNLIISLLIVIIIVGVYFFVTYNNAIKNVSQQAKSTLANYEKIMKYTKLDVSLDTLKEIEVTIESNSYPSYSSIKAILTSLDESYDKSLTDVKTTLTLKRDNYTEYNSLFRGELDTYRIHDDGTVTYINDPVQAIYNNMFHSEDISISNIEYDGDKLKFSVHNGTNETLTYLEFDIRVKDASGNVIDTDWTNWSGNLKPNDSAKVDAYVEDGASVSVNLSDWSY